MNASRYIRALALGLLILPCANVAAQGDATSADSLRAALDRSIGAVYEIVSGPAGQERDWTRFTTLFHPDARLVSIRRRHIDTVVTRSMTLQDFIERATASSRRFGFAEKEIHRQYERFGDLVHVWSAYEVNADGPQGARTWRGVNSFQLVREGRDFRILSIAWEDEAPGLVYEKPAD